jgi:hypothetical protein
LTRPGAADTFPALQRAVGNRAMAGLLQKLKAGAPGQATALAHEEARTGPGQPLEAGTQAQMEARFGRDFSQVRIHTGPGAADAARAVHAKAYTVGQDVVFAEGQYAPGSASGRGLLAHELAHTVQQRGMTGAPPSPEPGGPQETSAAMAARQIAGGGTVSCAMPACGVGLSRSPEPDRFENAFDDQELAAELSRIGERMQTPHYPGRDGDVRWHETLQEEATRRAKARGVAPPAGMPAPSGDPARDAAVAEAYAELARMDAEEKQEQEKEAAAEQAATDPRLPTTLSLLNLDPRFEDQQFTDDTVIPEAEISRRIQKKEDEKKEQELQRSDRTRHDRVMALRGKVASRSWAKRELAGLLRGYSGRDRQVLRRYGLKWYSFWDSKEHFKENILEAIDQYDYEWRKENTGNAADAPIMSELSPEDDYAIKKEQWQAQYYKYWLEGWQHVRGSALGGGAAYVASKVTDDPKKIAAAAGLATATSGAAGGWMSAKANKGTYVPDVENKPFDPTGEWRYSGPARTQEASKRSPEPDSLIPPIPRPTDVTGRTSFPREQEKPPAEPPPAEKTPKPTVEPKPPVQLKPPKPPKPPKTPKADASQTPKRPKPSTPNQTKAQKDAKYSDSLDKRIARVRNELSEAKQRTVEYKQARAAEDKSEKGGPSKAIWNKAEELYVLERARAHPDRTILEQVRLVGVKGPGGKIKPADEIAGEGRTLDFLEIDGAKILGGEVKSKAEIVHSVDDLHGSKIMGGFKDESKVGNQREKEGKIIQEAKIQGGTLVFKGKDVRTGESYTIEVGHEDYRSAVVAYDQILPD